MLLRPELCSPQAKFSTVRGEELCVMLIWLVGCFFRTTNHHIEGCRQNVCQKQLIALLGLLMTFWFLNNKCLT